MGIRGKMASDSANEVAKAINSFIRYSTNDQRSLLAVMEGYFTSMKTHMRTNG